MNDSELIAHLGGPAKVATLLNWDKEGGVQRVQNWITRGIPSKVKLDYPQFFLNIQQHQDQAATGTVASIATHGATSQSAAAAPK